MSLENYTHDNECIEAVVSIPESVIMHVLTTFDAEHDHDYGLKACGDKVKIRYVSSHVGRLSTSFVILGTIEDPTGKKYTANMVGKLRGYGTSPIASLLKKSTKAPTEDTDDKRVFVSQSIY